MLEAYVKKSFSLQYKSTIGADFLSKIIHIGNDDITANIWDTAGQEKLTNSLSRQFYRGSDACIIVFDITDKSSFTEIEKWLDAFLMQSASRVKNIQAIPTILVGNKVDLNDKRLISKAMALEFVKMNGMCEYFETSAKELNGVDEAFNYAIKKAVELLPQMALNMNSPPSLIGSFSTLINEEKKPSPKGCSC